MKVSVYSRESMERIIAEGHFPAHTAVISFYDPAIKHIDSSYTHIDYSGVCKHVFYSELDDLDLEVLKRKGYTYDTYFPEADAIAAFVYKAYSQGLDMICQCEYGQSRSAGCAAAILEHFYHNGISVFSDYQYYPNQVVYHKIYNALEIQKRCCENQCYHTANLEVLRALIHKLQMPEDMLADDFCENAHAVIQTKIAMEQALSSRGLLFHSASEIITRFLSGDHSLYASFSVTNPQYMCDSYLWDPYALYTYFRYGYESVPVVIWFHQYRLSADIPEIAARRKRRKRIHAISYNQIESFDFFGKLSWDSERNTIDAVPLMVTNIHLTFSKF